MSLNSWLATHYSIPAWIEYRKLVSRLTQHYSNSHKSKIEFELIMYRAETFWNVGKDNLFWFWFCLFWWFIETRGKYSKLNKGCSGSVISAGIKYCDSKINYRVSILDTWFMWGTSIECQLTFEWCCIICRKVTNMLMPLYLTTKTSTLQAM